MTRYHPVVFHDPEEGEGAPKKLTQKQLIGAARQGFYMRLLWEGLFGVYFFLSAIGEAVDGSLVWTLFYAAFSIACYFWVLSAWGKLKNFDRAHGKGIEP